MNKDYFEYNGWVERNEEREYYYSSFEPPVYNLHDMIMTEKYGTYDVSVGIQIPLKFYNYIEHMAELFDLSIEDYILEKAAEGYYETEDGVYI